ncbi:Hypothetical predicted protein [Scomber scombrus]|uniref:Uncharacterized protein n=1 Tax=Scomber scombrus TaxID=13677 RepID=A0AAV1Q039_SCOSC
MTAARDAFEVQRAAREGQRSHDSVNCRFSIKSQGPSIELSENSSQFWTHRDVKTKLFNYIHLTVGQQHNRSRAGDLSCQPPSRQPATTYQLQTLQQLLPQDDILPWDVANLQSMRVSGYCIFSIDVPNDMTITDAESCTGAVYGSTYVTRKLRNMK